MLKRIIIAACLALGIIGGSTLTQQVHAADADTTEVILHKRVFPKLQNDGTTHQNDGLLLDKDSELLTKTEGVNGITYDVYDATSMMQAAIDDGLSTSEFVENYTDRDRDSALQLINQLGLDKTMSATTAHDAQLDEDGIARLNLPSRSGTQTAAYYLIESEVANDDAEIDIAQTKPLMIVMNVKGSDGNVLNPLHIYPKNDIYARAPYFFKFGVDDDGDEHRLAGAEFVYSKVGTVGQTLYLAAKQDSAIALKWLESTDPANDENVARFTSDKNGLVSTAGIFFPSGEYAFYEVKAPDGYILDDTAITVSIPAIAQDQDGQQNIMVNGTAITENTTGILPNEVIEAAEARVYNYREGTLPDTDGEDDIIPPTTSTPDLPSTGGSTGIIPQLGNNSSTWLIVLGLIIMLGSVLIWRKRRHAEN